MYHRKKSKNHTFYTPVVIFDFSLDDRTLTRHDLLLTLPFKLCLSYVFHMFTEFKTLLLRNSNDVQSQQFYDSFKEFREQKLRIRQ